MEDKITSIRLRQSVKEQLQSLKEHSRETDDDLVIRLIKYVKDKEGLQ
jgi:predicted DNA-binding protein